MSGISFNNLNGGAKKSNVTYMKLNDGPNTFRILQGTIVPGYTYWVKGANGKDMPFEALQFVKDEERFDNTIRCPIRDAGLKDHEGKDLRCQWSYKCQVINKATGQVEVLALKKGMLGEIIEVAGQLELDPTCPETGTWLTVTKKKTGPHAFNVEYSLQQLKCKSEPLTTEELELISKAKPMSELFKAETYDEQAARLEKHLNGAEEQSNDSATQEAVNELDS